MLYKFMLPASNKLYSLSYIKLSNLLCYHWLGLLSYDYFFTLLITVECRVKLLHCNHHMTPVFIFCGTKIFRTIIKNHYLGLEEIQKYQPVTCSWIPIEFNIVGLWSNVKIAVCLTWWDLRIQIGQSL